MDIRPIVATLRRHKVIAWLLAIEIALTCAIVCNALFMITQGLQHMDTPSHVQERDLVEIQQAAIKPPPDRYARAQEDLAVLRQVPGVQQVAITNQLPFGGSSSNGPAMLKPNQRHATVNVGEYFGENLIPTLGLKLVAGRRLQADDYANVDVVLAALNSGSSKGFPMAAVITQALATRLWPGQNALGKLFYLSPVASLRVVGVVAGLVRANAYNDATAQYSVILPVHMGASKGESYLIRTRPADRASVLAAAVAALKRADPTRVITHWRTLTSVHREFYENDRAMVGMLIGVIVALLLITGLGIVGLASFWVGQRRRQIGIRRALGATRANILRYFQTENFLIVTVGIVLGMLLAFGLNLFLMQHYELPRLPWAYLPIGAVALWLLGQLAVLGPAMRASHVPPVVATRSV
ncbi:MAG TPA: FtsX-like permease family protein [Rhodanobacteraceae bacterium]